MFEIKNKLFLFSTFFKDTASSVWDSIKDQSVKDSTLSAWDNTKDTPSSAWDSTRDTA